MTQLRTDRLLLRGLTESDVQDMVRYLNDERYNHYIPEFNYPYTQEHALTYVKNSSADEPVNGELTWGIEYEGKLIGIVNLHHIDANRRNAMIGYSVSFAHAGKGFASEAAKRVVEFAFSEYGIEHLSARVYEGNPASARVLEKIGFRKVGVMKGHTYHREKMLDCSLYALRKKDFKKQ